MLTLEMKLRFLKQKPVQSEGTQADPPSSSCSCFNRLPDNNNTTTVLSSTKSISTQTYLPPSDSDIAPTVSIFSCLVCSENFVTADELIIHAHTEHDLS